MCDVDASIYSEYTPNVKRTRGRPKGSNNKSSPQKSLAPPAHPKKRGRPKGSPNKSTAQKSLAPPAHPKKRSPDKHTRKSPTSTAAATLIQRYARRYINDYTSLVSQSQTN